jgi:hypothetical protein
MPSTYTTNLGIEKITTGDQAGLWGATTNTNFDIIDQAVNGIVAATLSSAGSSSSPNTLDIANGSTSDGRNKFIELTDGGDLGATAYVQLTPNDAEKIVFVRNSLSGGRAVIIFQGTYSASNDFELANGKDAVLKFNGAGTGATVTQVFVDLVATNVTANLTGDVTGNVTGNVTGAVTGNVSGNLTGNVTGDVTGNVTGNITSSGTSSFSNIDANGGAVDGVVIGANSAAAGTFTNLTVSGTSTLTTVDINAGDIDGTNIGAATPGAGTFSALATTGDNIRIDTTQTPASSSASGTAGEIAWDTSYIYVCVATNTWKRVALSTF